MFEWANSWNSTIQAWPGKKESQEDRYHNPRVQRRSTDNNKALVVRECAAAGSAARFVCNSREKVLHFAIQCVL